jgi:hypothetical protein
VFPLVDNIEQVKNLLQCNMAQDIENSTPQRYE